MPSVTLATWNVRRPYRPNDACFEAIARKLRKLPADIWVLTETHHALSPGEGYQPFASPPLPAHPDRRVDERTTIVWVRPDWQASTIPTFAHLGSTEAHPRTTLSYAVTSADTSPAACVLVETPVGPLLVYGTVITWPNDLGPFGEDPAQKAGYAQMQHDSILAHGEDWKRLHAKYPSAQICVAGDLNTTLDGRRLPTIACSDGLHQALANVEMRHVTQTLDNVIDHICLSKPWADWADDPCWWQTTYIDDRTRERKPVSDHRGVMVTVTPPA